MPKVVLFIATSLDGYIASSDGTVEWLFHDADYGYTEFMASLDAVVMGRKTWEQAKTFEAIPFAGTQVFVFSRTLPASSDERIHHVQGEPVVSQRVGRTSVSADAGWADCMSGHTATTEDFEKLDIRVGRVIDVQPYPEGRYSTHILRIDFGPELGMQKSLAKLAPNYAGPEIVERQVLAAMNCPPRQIGKHLSEVLTLGVPDENGNVILLRPDQDVPLGGKLY